MTHTTLFVGIDVAKAKFDVALLNAEGKYRSKVFPNTPPGYLQLLEWLTRHDAPWKPTSAWRPRVSIWAWPGPFSGPTAAARQRGQPGPDSCLWQDRAEPRQNRQGRCPAYRPLLPDAPASTLGTPSRGDCHTTGIGAQRLEDLLGLQTMENSRLEAATGPARESVEAVLQFIEQQIEMVRLQIQIHIDQHPRLKSQKELLSSIPGIGDNTAATLLAFLSPVERFHSAKQVVAYAGLNPRIRQSGQWAGKSPIAKTGNALLRKALYLPAVVAKHHNPIIAAFCDRLLARGKRPMQVVVAAMRRLLHLVFGVLKSGKPFDPKFGLA